VHLRQACSAPQPMERSTGMEKTASIFYKPRHPSCAQTSFLLEPYQKLIPSLQSLKRQPLTKYTQELFNLQTDNGSTSPGEHVQEAIAAQLKYKRRRHPYKRLAARVMYHHLVRIYVRDRLMSCNRCLILGLQISR
jgi:hypothetical protein